MVNMFCIIIELFTKVCNSFIFAKLWEWKLQAEMGIGYSDPPSDMLNRKIGAYVIKVTPGITG